jgi:cytochrome c5
MKKQSFLILLVTALFLSSAAYLKIPEKAAKNTKAVQESSIPADVHAIFENSCMGCHAEGGRMMAISHVNFSEWNSYTPEKQANKAKDICDIVTKGKMPPKSAVNKDPKIALTQEQIESICKWSASLNEGK